MDCLSKSVSSLVFENEHEMIDRFLLECPVIDRTFQDTVQLGIIIFSVLLSMRLSYMAADQDDQRLLNEGLGVDAAMFYIVVVNTFIIAVVLGTFFWFSEEVGSFWTS